MAFNSSDDTRILNIISCDGWFAAYKMDDLEGKIAYLRVLCWVLMEDAEGYQSLDAFAGAGDPTDLWLVASKVGNFVGFYHKDDLPPDAEILSNLSENF